MTAHETTPSDAAIGQAFRETLPDGHQSAVYAVRVSQRAREIEQGRDAVAKLPEPMHWVSYSGAPLFTIMQMTAYGEACRRMPSADAWAHDGFWIEYESAPVEVGQQAPGPTTYVRRDYWVAKCGQVTESKFTSYELAKAHVPSLPPHGESR